MRALARLEDLVVVTWAADPAALAAVLPDGVDVDEPLVSAVAYSYRDLHLAGLPRPRLACGQIHLRTYVRVGDEAGVWFLDTVQDSRWAAVPRWLWGMPWRRGPVEVRHDGDSVTAAADDVRLAVSPSPDTVPPDEVTVDPTIGWYAGRGRVRRFSVTYTPEPPVPATVEQAAAARLVSEGLLAADAAVSSAFVRSQVDIEIELPPR